MTVEDARVMRIASPPIHPFLALIPATCFTGALLTDLAYWGSAQMMWADFSAWLISAGVVLALLFAIVGLVEMIVRPSLRERSGMVPYVLGYLVALALATFNMLIHSRDAWTSVVPSGLVLSALTVLVLVGTAFAGALLVYRPRHGVDYQ
ncbi:DUF2231 domain-containing protein [Ancylobacter mangrovi]|uniref:DUF2231 domain-containing protein n=1 Tax=Ancylobacter mangrovi TaxID=2972472 RepID=UPI0021631AD0|nr:DUF2231 domain-containing protein [Ancylobacter mangrovi]MCS0501251.1 DUF2231 domain-containing protein [Ancylobacter mangrovi]